MTTKKRCNKCAAEKPLGDFYDAKGKKNGKAGECKTCRNIYARDRHRKPEVRQRKLEYNRRRMQEPEYREKQKMNGRKYYQSLEGRANTLWKNARKSPSGKTKEFSLTVEHILDHLKKGACSVTGTPFHFDNAHQIVHQRKKNPYSPSVDRIDPKTGYTNENTRVVIWWYNMAKGELSDAEMKQFCEIVVRAK